MDPEIHGGMIMLGEFTVLIWRVRAIFIAQARCREERGTLD